MVRADGHGPGRLRRRHGPEPAHDDADHHRGRAPAEALGRGGSLVALSSVAGLTAMPFGAPYAAAKSAFMSLVRTEALEWGSLGIRVNAVAPAPYAPRRACGAIPTRRPTPRLRPPHSPRASRKRRRHRRSRALPAVRSGGWITGQVLAVDGSSSARPSFLGEDNLPVFVRDRGPAGATHGRGHMSPLKVAVGRRPDRDPPPTVADALRALGAHVAERPVGRASIWGVWAPDLVVWAPGPGASAPTPPAQDWRRDAGAARPLRDAVACFQAADRASGEVGAIVAVLPTIAMNGRRADRLDSTAEGCGPGEGGLA